MCVYVCVLQLTAAPFHSGSFEIPFTFFTLSPTAIGIDARAESEPKIRWWWWWWWWWFFEAGAVTAAPADS